MAKIPGYTHHAGKGSTQEFLPNRSAMTKLVGGDPLQRTISNYAKATPSGLQTTAPNILGQAQRDDGASS